MKVRKYFIFYIFFKLGVVGKHGRKKINLKRSQKNYVETTKGTKKKS